MKKALVILSIFISTTLWGADVAVGLIDLDKTIPCPNGGEIVLTGGYYVVNFNITADLEFKDCKYVDDEDTITLNGTASLSGTLPTSAGNLNLTVDYKDVQFNSVSSDETMNEKCSGSFTFTGEISNGSGNVSRTGTLNCSGSGNSKMSINSLITDILHLDF